MKHLKSYENIYYKIQDIYVLRDHIETVLTKSGGYGCERENINNNEYESLFGKTKGKNRIFMFSIKYIRTTTNLYLEIYIDDEEETLDKNAYHIPEYFKNIDGINFIKRGDKLFKTVFKFKILDTVDNIIKRISYNDIEALFNANKYNL